MQDVWVFVGSGARLPSGVFSSLDSAKRWIALHALSGLLTKYPLDMGAWDWAIANQYFRLKGPHQNTSAFIGGFTSARMEHYHFQDGEIK
jgi:hypothetical protein